MNLDHYALSILLHDIGKFWERSSDAPTPSAEERHEFCPILPGSSQYSHDHAALSARFIREWARAPGAELWGPKHHLPDPSSREQVCAALADLLSWGERDPDETREAQAASSAPLQPALSAADPGGAPRYHPLARLDNLVDALVPQPHAALSREHYRHHWHHFLRALELAGRALERLETWLALLEVFTARMPAASTNRRLKEFPDVNLFDHSRAAAALAAALWKSPLSIEALNALRERLYSDPPESHPPLACLAAGEVQGAGEPFSGRGAGRRPERLAGCAVLPELIADAAGRRLLERLGMPLTSLLWSGTTRFAVLVPPGAEEEMGIARDEIERALAAAGRPDLGLEIAAVPIGLGELRGGIAAAWRALETRLHVAGRRRLARIAAEDFDRAFGFLEDRERTEEGAEIEEIGRGLAGARALARRPADGGRGGLLAAVHRAVAPVEGLGGGDRESIEALVALGRLDLDAIAPELQGSNAALGWRIPGTACHRLKDLDGGSSAPLGALRVRIDRPGWTAGGGLSRLATLLAEQRRALAALASGCLAEAPARGASIGLARALEDGLEVLGSPAGLPGAAAEIHRRLRQILGASPELSIRAGIGVAPGPDPVPAAFRAAGEALEEARAAGGAGDRIGLLGAVLAFEEIPPLAEEAERISAAIPAGAGRRLLAVLIDDARPDHRPWRRAAALGEIRERISGGGNRPVRRLAAAARWALLLAQQGEHSEP